VKVEIGCVADLTRHTKAVNTLRFSPCGKFLASADDGKFKIKYQLEIKLAITHRLKIFNYHFQMPMSTFGKMIPTKTNWVRSFGQLKKVCGSISMTSQI